MICMYVLGKRMTMLKRGQLDVVQFLRGLPRTVHYSKSFIVDCLYSTVSAAIVFKWAHDFLHCNCNIYLIFTPYLIQSQQTAFVVNGLFSECEQIFLSCIVNEECSAVTFSNYCERVKTYSVLCIYTV